LAGVTTSESVVAEAQTEDLDPDPVRLRKGFDGRLDGWFRWFLPGRPAVGMAPFGGFGLGMPKHHFPQKHYLLR
jgi:hypothetical protein